jgi:ribosomal protein S18 acetylase RimI-like enzyme
MITIGVLFFHHVTFGINRSEEGYVISSVLSLRDFVPSDYPELISWFPDAAALRLFAGTSAQWPLTIDGLSARAEAQVSEAFTAVLDDSDVAVGHVELIRETQEQVRLARIAIAPNLRGQGLVAQLLERSSDYAREAGFRWISLLVLPENLSAKRAYTRAGYVGVGPSPVHPEYTKMLLRI